MDRLAAGARAAGLALSERQIAQFQILYKELVEWNRRFNLTAITEYEQVQIRHFLDSLSCLLPLSGCLKKAHSAPLRCIDIGSGAGFPGLPLKIYLPRMPVVLLEATGKKVTFIQHIVDRLELEGAWPLKGRAETVGQQPEHREQYDLVVARAVAEMSILAEFMLPFCRLGGWVIAQKGPSAPEETQAAEYAISMLGGRVKQVVPVELLGLAESRNLVVVEKVARTPAAYPRRPGMPAKRPLRKK